MAHLDTTLVRRNLERIVADLDTAILQPETFREGAGRLSRLASEVTVAYEAAFTASAAVPSFLKLPDPAEMPTA